MFDIVIHEMFRESDNPTPVNGLSVFCGIVETGISCIRYLHDKPDYPDAKLKDIITENDLIQS